MVPQTCLHPIRVFNKSLGHFINVPCGHCEACRVITGLRRSSRINLVFNEYRFRYFVTLTYRDECLPIATYDNLIGSIVSPNDCDYNGEVYHINVDSECVLKSYNFLKPRFKKYGGLPVLSHSDLIGFKKRFRKELYEKLGYYPFVFIYAAGEYGLDTSKSQRPHYHLCIGFNDVRIERVFRESVYNAWRMYRKYSSQNDLRLIGKVDIQRVTSNGCANYCASYLNCVYDLPPVLKESCFRPFSTCSPTGDRQLCKYDVFDLREVFDRLPIKASYVDNGKIVDCLLPSLYRNRFFPKLPNYGCFTLYDRICLYRTYERVVSTVGNLEMYFNDLWNNKLHGRFFTPTNFDILIDNFFLDLSDRFKSFTKFKRLYYVSRRVTQNAYTLGVSIDDYVKRIDDFYYKIEMDKFKRFYHYVSELESDFYHPCDLKKIFHLYNQTDFENLYHREYYQKQFGVDFHTTCNSHVLWHQLQYEQKMYACALDNSKTHKRNDVFASSCRRKTYIPILSSLKSKVLQRLTT